MWGDKPTANSCNRKKPQDKAKRSAATHGPLQYFSSHSPGRTMCEIENTVETHNIDNVHIICTNL